MKKLYSFATAMLFFSLNLTAQTLPYQQAFTTFLPTGWVKVNGGDLNSGPGSAFGLWSQGTFLNNSSGSQSAKVQLYTYNQVSWLITNSFNLPAGSTYTVSFDYAATDWYSQNTPSNTSIKDDVFALLVSVDGGTTWSALQTWNSPNSTMTNNLTTFSTNLTNVSGANVKFAFYANDGYSFFPGGIDLFIDNFKVEVSTLGTSDLMTAKPSVYPNPTEGMVFISSQKKIQSVEVYNTVGQKLLSSSSAQVDLSTMNSGIYFLKTTFKDGSSSVEKIIRK